MSMLDFIALLIGMFLMGLALCVVSFLDKLVLGV